MSAELRTILAITRRLPKVWGVGVIGNFLARYYSRKNREDVDIDVLDFRMRLTPGESVSSNACLFMPQLYDHKEITILRQHLKPGDVFVDVGAHIGFYALVAAQLVGEYGSVLAIEADPEIHSKLSRNIALNDMKNVRTVNRGVSDRKETLELSVNTTNRGASSFIKEKEGRVTVMVPCLPLLDIIEEAGIAKVKGMKIDIEGYEYKVLEQFLGEKAFPVHQPHFIIVENNTEVYGERLTNMLIRTGYTMQPIRRRNYLFIKD